MNVFNGLMHQSAEKHRAFSDRSKFQILEKTILFRAILKYSDVRGKRVFTLEVYLPHGLERKLRKINITPG